MPILKHQPNASAKKILIDKIPGTGLRIRLSGCTRQRIYIGGPDYWYPDNQNLLTHKLAPFLPAMVYDPLTNTVTASMAENNREWLSESRDISEVKVPVEMKRLLDALANLKAEIDHTEINSNSRKLISQFRLPDPESSPEFYRVYTKGRRKHLAIIWGLEKSSTRSYLYSDNTLWDKIKAIINEWKKWWKYFYFIFCLLLTFCAICGAISFFCSDDDSPAAKEAASPTQVSVPAPTPAASSTEPAAHQQQQSTVSEGRVTSQNPPVPSDAPVTNNDKAPRLSASSTEATHSTVTMTETANTPESAEPAKISAPAENSRNNASAAKSQIADKTIARSSTVETETAEGHSSVAQAEPAHHEEQFTLPAPEKPTHAEEPTEEKLFTIQLNNASMPFSIELTPNRTNGDQYESVLRVNPLHKKKFSKVTITVDKQEPQEQTVCPAQFVITHGKTFNVSVVVIIGESPYAQTYENIKMR